MLRSNLPSSLGIFTLIFSSNLSTTSFRMLEWFNSSFCSWTISLSSLIVDSEIPTSSLSFLFEDATGVLLLRDLAKGSGYSVNSYLHLCDNKQKSRQKCFTNFRWWKVYINHRELSLSKKRYQYKRASRKEGKGLEKSRSSHRRCCAKMLFLKILQCSLENTCVGASFQ